MADKRVADLPVLGVFGDDDLVLVSSASQAYAIKTSTLKEAAKGDPGPPGIQGPPGPEGKQGPKGEPGTAVAKGATFTPNVSDTGDLSWSNDGGLDNPPTVNVKGPQGDTGPRGLQGETGEKGDTGNTGPKGDPGVSPTIDVGAVPGGHDVTITGAEGSNTFSVKDGISPTIETKAMPDGYEVTINGADGAHTFRVYDGASTYEFGHGLSLDKSANTVSVDMYSEGKDDSLPVSEARMMEIVGDIEALLRTI